MNFNFLPSWSEYVFIGIFICIYLLFLWRNYIIAKRLNTYSSSKIVKLLLRSSYFLLFIVASLGPSFGEMKQEVKSVGKDIFIAIDLSESMNAFDVQPSRLEKVKYELKNLISKFSSDRVGIIIFSSEAFVQCPLTHDQNALALFIETLNTRLVPNTGTEFAAPLKLIFDKFEKERQNNQGKPTTQIALLISDGEDFSEETNDFVAKFEEESIKIFTLGVGTEQGSKIPARNGFKKDKKGQEVITQLNSKQLKDIAARTNADYFEINAQMNEVPALIGAISNIEGNLRETRKVDISADKYYYFLLAALGLMALDVLLTVTVIRI
jgi:Ca-activated chloride channel family protein